MDRAIISPFVRCIRFDLTFRFLLVELPKQIHKEIEKTKNLSLNFIPLIFIFFFFFKRNPNALNANGFLSAISFSNALLTHTRYG